MAPLPLLDACGDTRCDQDFTVPPKVPEPFLCCYSQKVVNSLLKQNRLSLSCVGAYYKLPKKKDDVELLLAVRRFSHRVVDAVVLILR